MTNSVLKTFKWIGPISRAGLIAIAASPLAGTPTLAAGPAGSTGQQIAQSQQQQQYPPPSQQQKQQKKNPQGGRLQYRQGGQQQYQQGGQQQYQQGGQQPYQQGGQQPYQQGGQQPYQQGHRYDWSAYQPGHPPPQWQQYHQNFDPRPYQWNQYADHSYRWQPYVQPRGWYYRRWAYGQTLPPMFWGRDYWLVNYWGFGLIDPPYGYVWVRYGNDALLINVVNGQILGVVYWLFY